MHPLYGVGMNRAYLLFAIFVCACDCGTTTIDDGVGAPCVTDDDCRFGLSCTDDMCEEPIQIDASVPEDSNGVDVMSCPPVQVCGDDCCSAGTVCGGSLCCEASELCGGLCCGDSQACVADSCVLACQPEEAPCGEGAETTCCGAGDVCYLSECTTPGDACTRSTDCDAESYCEATIGRCLPRAPEGDLCEYRPELEDFSLVEKWSWTGDEDAYPTHDQVMMAPMVANMTDDNDDGLIDENDIPDVVFSTFTGSSYWGQFTDQIGGVLRIISGADGAQIFPTETTIPNPVSVTPGGEITIADVDPSSLGPEIMVCSRSDNAGRQPGHLMILSAGGALLRRFDTAPNIVPCGFDAPAVGDMDGDGTPEIVVRYIIAHADGTVVQRLRPSAGASGAYTALYNIDDDEDLELVGGSGAYNYDGTTVWVRDGSDGRPSVSSAHLAIADLDLDGAPDVVTVGGHVAWALEGATGDTIWGPVDINPPELMDQWAASPGGGGPPTIANFDEDPNPEVAFAGGYAYVVLEHDGTRKWWFETQDRSSRSTGSSIFDFEGDGIAEVLYNDERFLRVFRGTDGSVFYDQCNLSGTLREFPIVVDVDNDDHAEIVLMENNYAFSGVCVDGTAASTGIHVFGHPDNQWVRTRRIWNQHTYHVTNINEDGTVPTREVANHSREGLNNFRQNVQPDGLFDAPDLQLVDLQASTRTCPESFTLRVRVINRGRAGAPAGVPVTFYEVVGGVQTNIARTVTTRPLLAGESELLEVPFAIPVDRDDEMFSFVAVLNDPSDSPLVGLNECDIANNDAGPVMASCPLIQ